jgi:hypothetical protein
MKSVCDLDFIPTFTSLINLFKLHIMKQSLFSTVLVLIVSAVMLQAQDYKSSIGGKLGYGLVASYKTFLNEKSGIDIFGGIHWGGSLMGGANYSIHADIKSVDNLRWYYGAGANFFAWTAGTYNWAEVGVSGNVGLEYTFNDIPLNISLDYVPTFVVYDTDDFDNVRRFRSGYGALTARYILKR